MVPPSALWRELRRIPIPRTRVNKGKKRARGYYAPKANKCTQNAALRKRKPRRSGAFLVNRRTSLVTQTAGHASVAEVAQEAVARARLVPEDVRLVMAKVVAGYGVVPGLRRSAVRRDYDPARDTGGARGDVAREVVARKLHATRANKRDPDPREIAIELPGSTRARIVLDRVAFHLELTYRFRLESIEEHASAVVVDRVSGEGAAVGVFDEDAPRAARDVVADDLRVCGFLAGQVRSHDAKTADVVGDDGGSRRVDVEDAGPVVFEIIPRDSGIDAILVNLDREVVFGDASDIILHDRGVARIACNNDPFGVGIRVAYDIILRDSGVDVLASDDPAGDFAYETVSHNSSVAGSEKVDREQSLLFILEAPEREASNAHTLHALVDLEGIEVYVANNANALRSESL